MIADHMFFGDVTYKDNMNTRVPRVTYRCICGEAWS